MTNLATTPRSFWRRLSSRGLVTRGLVLQAVALTYSLAAGAFRSNPPSLRSESEGLVRLCIAVGAGMVALAARSRSTSRHDRSPGTLVVDLLLVYGCVVLSQVVLNWSRPELALPCWAPTQGGYVGVMLFAATRALFAIAPGGDDSLPEWVDDRRQELAIRCGRYGGAGAGAFALGLAGLWAVSVQVRIASCWIAIGSAYLLVRAACAHREVASDRIDQGLRRCDSILRAAAVWYCGALFPASLVALFGSNVYVYWIPLVILLFAEGNQRAADSLAKNTANSVVQAE